MNTNLFFPKTLALCEEKNIRLHLGPCKIHKTLVGKFCLVSPIFGAGYFGSFDSSTGRFFPNKQCTPQMIDLLKRVEEEGLKAVASIGILTGVCSICGRTLTDENSIAIGIGKICAGKVGYAYESVSEEL